MVLAKLRENLAAVRERIERANRRTGRSPGAVRLIAVTKQVDADVARELVDLGVPDLGESRPQELWRKHSLVPGAVRWHLIGPLQRNKARRTLPLVSLIHSVDSLALLERLDQLAGELALSPDVLLEVNVSGETTKQGLRPDETAGVIAAAAGLSCVRVTGLMTMAPYHAAAEQARLTFAGLREMRDRLLRQAPPNCPLAELSMGMSGDFEPAIEEGATMVRIGSALFEGISQRET